MKIRVGFVSNSSSSSFIVAFKESDKCPHCGRGDPSFLQMVRDSASRYNDNEVHARGLKDVLREMSYQDADEEEVAKVENAKLEEGEELACVELSYHETELRAALKNISNVRVILELE